MKKTIYFWLVVVFIFSLTIFSVVPIAEAEESMVILIGKKSVVLSAEDGKISPELLHGFLISLERLLQTWAYDEYHVIILRHSEAMTGKSTGTADLNKGVFQFYGHFCDGKRDISKKLYR